jgi:hypothetical protein
MRSRFTSIAASAGSMRSGRAPVSTRCDRILSVCALFSLKVRVRCVTLAS